MQSIGDNTLMGNRSENFIPDEGKTYEHGEESDVFQFSDSDVSDRGKSFKPKMHQGILNHIRWIRYKIIMVAQSIIHLYMLENNFYLLILERVE